MTKDGQRWELGTADDVAWITESFRLGSSVTTAIPPVFEAYATFHPVEGQRWDEVERALVDVLRQHTSEHRWWLGYLETGVDDLVFPQAPRVQLYAGWPYVLVRAGAEQALGWRRGQFRAASGDGALPDLVFPADRSWCVSSLWDDAWSCVGGTAALIESLCQTPTVNARRVSPDEDCLPPGLSRQ